MPYLKSKFGAEELADLLLKHKKILQEEYGVKHLKIFGSYARGEQEEDSDVDILVSLDEEVDLLEFVGLKFYLEEILGLPVDLLSDRGISPLLRAYIERWVIEVF